MLETLVKIKPMTELQLVLALDRLTRFKCSEDKYVRVFKDVIASNLISPKFKKNQMASFDYSVLTEYATEIINYSIQDLGQNLSGDYSINDKLLKYEQSVFKCDENVLKLLKNEIDYKAALPILQRGISDPPYECGLPLNLVWLISLAVGKNQVNNRERDGLKFPIEKILIVEGITEEILLPKFAKLCGYDFDKAGIHLISAGGKNQVVKLFYQFADILKLPMFVLLDSDAKENHKEIQSKFRKCDKVHVIKCGEFEDILPLNLIKRTLNRHLRNYSSVKIDDLRKNQQMTHTLDEILKERGLEFKKAEFASLVSSNIESKSDVSAEVEQIISELF